MQKENSGHPNRLLIYLLSGLAIILVLNLISSTYLLQVVFPFLKAGYLVFENLCLGFFLWVVFSPSSRLDEKRKVPFFSAFALGLIVTFSICFIFSFSNLLNTWTMAGFYLLPLTLLPAINKHWKHEFIETFQDFFHRPRFEYFVFLVPLIFASLPSSFYDALSFHLGIPNLYLQNNGFSGAEQLFYAHTSVYYEITLIPAIFSGDLVPRLFHLLTGSLLILAAVDLGVEWFAIKKRYLLMLTLISMPMTLFLLTAVKNDMASPVFILPGMYWLLKKRPGLAALFWGFSLGVKYTNVIPAAIFLLLYFFKTPDKKKFLKQGVVFALIATAALVPLFVKNYVFTGNPVFPFFHDHFSNRLPYWDASRFKNIEDDAQKLFNSPWDIVKFPLTVTFQELGSGGISGPLLLMFLPFLVILKRRKEIPLWLLGFAALSLAIGGNFKLSTRIWFTLFLIFCMGVPVVLEEIQGRLRSFLMTLFFIAVGYNVITGIGLCEYLYRSYQLYSGTTSVETYKARFFSTYPAIDFVNRFTPPGSRIILAGEAKSFYLRRPYRVSSGYDFSILRSYLEKSDTVMSFHRALKDGGIDYLILNLNEYRRLQEEYKNLPEDLYRKSLDFLKHFTPVFSRDNTFVYKI